MVMLVTRMESDMLCTRNQT